MQPTLASTLEDAYENEQAEPATRSGRSGEDTTSNLLHENEQASGSWDPETQKLLHRAKMMSDKNKKAQKRYRDKQREKVDGYKRQVDELTQQVQQLLAEKAGSASAAPKQQQTLCIEGSSSQTLRSNGSHGSLRSCSDQYIDFSDKEAVCSAILELINDLTAHLPEQQHLVLGLCKSPGDTLDCASQTLINIWLAYVAEMSRLLGQGAEDSSRCCHAELIRLCDAVQAARMEAFEKHPGLITWLHVRLKHVGAASNCISVLEVVRLSVHQLSGVLQARRALQAGLRAIAEQRLQSAQPLLSVAADGSEVHLAEHHLRHYHACQHSQALLREENRCFMGFHDAVFKALGPITIARLWAENPHLDFLTLSAAIDKALACPSPPTPKHQLPQQLFADGHAYLTSCSDDLPDFGSLSPDCSSDLFGSLDFLQDPMLSPGLGV
ncbi:hypothetical protein WJX74_007707 [Apatococcus lobatus]|uniref:BZIP domain-containing protein n=2 Tax=Apatococcus TaxID=904362 RepID=A0AAW1TEP4_9CHLO